MEPELVRELIVAQVEKCLGLGNDRNIDGGETIIIYYMTLRQVWYDIHVWRKYARPRANDSSAMTGPNLWLITTADGTGKYTRSNVQIYTTVPQQKY